MARMGRSVLDSSLGSSGTTGGGGGTFMPSTFCTTQLPRFTGEVRRPGEYWVMNTAMGKMPPRPYLSAPSTRTQVLASPATSGMP